MLCRCLQSRHMVMCQWPRKTCGTQVLFTGTAKSLFSTPHISITTEPISIKFTYFMPSIYTILHTKFEEDQISSLRDMCFWKLPNFLQIFLLTDLTTTITLSQPSPGWISFKFGTLMRHILAHFHLKFGDVKLNLK